jgi:hypothetical protein
MRRPVGNSVLCAATCTRGADGPAHSPISELIHNNNNNNNNNNIIIIIIVVESLMMMMTVINMT